MKLLMHMLALAIVYTPAPLAYASPIVDLQVNGRVTPSACTVSLVGDDLKPLQTVASADRGESWAPEVFMYPDPLMGFARFGETLPAPVQQRVASLRVSTSISPANTLTPKEEVPLDGLITLDLIDL